MSLHEQLIRKIEAILGTEVAYAGVDDKGISGEYRDSIPLGEGVLLFKDKTLTPRERALLEALMPPFSGEDFSLEAFFSGGRLPEKIRQSLHFPLKIWWLESEKGIDDLVDFFRTMFPEDSLLKKDSRTLVVLKAVQDPQEYSVTDIHSDLEATVFEDIAVFVSQLLKSQAEMPAGFEVIRGLRAIHGILNRTPKIYEFDKMLLSGIFHHSLGSEEGGSVKKVLSLASPLSLEEELRHTAGEFLFCNLNITDTANKLFIHRNTLIYRLGRIKSLTGYDIRNFLEAVNFYSLFLYQEFKQNP
jgi:hypothetical protein